MDLVILAGGLGSRFGGNKQTQEVDKDGNFIIDYSIFDALKVGFDRIVLIIKKEYKELFDQTLAKRVGKDKITYVFQEKIDAFGNKVEREKPLGMAHAILSAKEVVKDNFVVINADDFYGRNSFKKAYEFLAKTDKNSTNFAIVGFKLINTLNNNEFLRRAICDVENEYITNIEESDVSRNGDKIEIRRSKDWAITPYHENMIASMNMLCFTPQIFKYLEKEFEKFCLKKENLESKEFIIQPILSTLAKENKATIKLLTSDEKWFGMTFKKDLDKVQNELENLKEKGIYPNHLWK